MTDRIITHEISPYRAWQGPESEAPAGVKQSLTTDDELRAALRKCVDMLDALVAESGRGYGYGEEDPFRMGEWFEAEDLAFIEEARIRALPAHGQPPAPAVKVKPLVWEHDAKFCGQDCSYADTEFGAWTMTAYSGRDGRWAHTDPNGNDSEDDWSSREECEAAAQADYEARILSALEGAQ